MVAEVIAVGKGMLSGAPLESAVDFLAGELAALGIELRFRSTVGDDRLRLQKCIAAALARSELVITLGGLEGGEEGFTVAAVAEVLELECRPHPQTLARLQKECLRREQELSLDQERLALLPHGAAVFQGPALAPPGCALSAGRQCILLLPGRMQELRPMLLDQGIPYLVDFLGSQAAAKTMRVFGAELHEIEELLGDLLDCENPVTAIYPRNLELMVRVIARDSEGRAQELCAGTAAVVEERLGCRIYGGQRDRLPRVVVQALRKEGRRISAVECGTENGLARLLGGVPGVNHTMLPPIIAEDWDTMTDRLLVPGDLLEELGCLSPEVTAAMAQGAMESQGEPLGLAVTAAAQPEEDGPNYGAACVALCDGQQVWVRELFLAPLGDEPPEAVQRLAALHALDLLRIYLTFPQAMPQSYELPRPANPIVAAVADLSQPGALIPLEEEPAPVPRKKNLLPQKGDTPGVRVRKLVLLAALVVLLAALSFLGWYTWDQGRDRRLAAAWKEQILQAEQAGAALPQDYPQDYLPQFAPWWQINRHVAGKLEIPGTEYLFPVVQADDNKTYLQTSFDGRSGGYGTPFVDCRANLQRESSNTIIYGQSLWEDQLFEALAQYRDIGFYRQHPVIAFDSVYREADYKIIAVFSPGEDGWGGAWDFQKFVDGSLKQFQQYAAAAREHSLITVPVDVRPGDKLLTLSAQAREEQIAVIARKVRPGESCQVDVEAAGPNDGSPSQESSFESSSMPSESASAPSSSDSEASQDEGTSSASASVSSSEPAGAANSGSSSASVSSVSSESSSSVSSRPESSQPPPPSSSEESVSSQEPEPSEAESMATEESGTGGYVSAEEAPPEERDEEPEPDDEDDGDDSRQDEDEAQEEDRGDGGGRGGPIEMDETVRVNGSRLEAYDAVCRIVMNETGGAFHQEALKAQAVAVYSRLVARGGSLTGMNLRTPNSAVEQAVKAVWGETIRSGSRTVDAFFCASTAGATNTSQEVWGGVTPGHTENVDSHWDEDSPGYEYTKKMSRDSVVNAVYNAFGIDLEEVAEEDWFEVKSYTGGGYNDRMTVGGEVTTTGRYLRESVLKLRSACFEWEFDSNGDLIFTTYGYGHGVGLSQHGANAMAGEGYDYVEILEHYFAGCSVE